MRASHARRGIAVRASRVALRAASVAIDRAVRVASSSAASRARAFERARRRARRSIDRSRARAVDRRGVDRRASAIDRVAIEIEVARLIDRSIDDEKDRASRARWMRRIRIVARDRVDTRGFMSATVASPETAKKQREEDAQRVEARDGRGGEPDARGGDDGDDGDGTATTTTTTTTDDERRRRRRRRAKRRARARWTRRRRRRRTKRNDRNETATDEDYARLDAYLSTGFGLVHADGKDGEGRTVVTVNATRIPGWAGTADRDNSMNLIINTLERVAAAGEYVVVVYFGDDDRTKGVVPTHSLNWLGDLHDKLAYAVRKNVQKIVFVNATWIMSAIISLSMTFASSKASKKFAWTKSLDDMDKDTGYHVHQVMCGEKFLASVGRKVVYAEPEAAAPAPDAS